jgi:hypothetical protein
MAKMKFSPRFAELLIQCAAIEATVQQKHSDFTGPYKSVDGDKLLGWKVKCRNLLSSACGETSEHYKQFAATSEPQSYRDNWQELQQLRAVLLAAQEDYDGGYLASVRALVQAEVFSTELDQAKGLLGSGYATPAAVVAGVVLETTLRQMCADNGIPAGKLDKMNADLAKAGIYNLLVQKRITALADIRNSAAHGHPENFSEVDVSDMISYVEGFLAERL